LALGYQPEMEAPAILNGSRPWDVGVEVVGSLVSLPRAEGMNLLALLEAGGKRQEVASIKHG
jgi:hypothetical protein